MKLAVQTETTKPALSATFAARWRVFWGYCLAVGIYAITVGFFVFPSNGGIQSSYYSLVALPTLMIMVTKPSLAVHGRWLLLFLGAPLFLAISSFWSDPNVATTYREPSFFIKMLAILAFLYFAIAYVMQTYKHFSGLWVIVLGWVAGASALVGLVDYLVQHHGAIPGQWPRFKGIAWGGDTNRVAAFYTVGFLACVYLAYFKQGLCQVISVLCALPPVLVVMLAQSKVPFLVIVATVLLVIATRVTTRDWRWLAAGAVVFVGLGLWLSLGTNTFARVYSFFIRWELWQAAIASLNDNWLWGTGLNYRVSLTVDGTVFGQPHNFLVDTLRFAGVIGLTLLVAQMVATLVVVIKSLPSMPIMWFYGGWFLSGVGTALVEAQQPLMRPSYVWFLYWLPTVFIWHAYQSNKLPSEGATSAQVGES
ncbi:O-antigen ligase family protein [Halioxenophilus aromaticivorans]|uniref:O-antigen ligase-related domain-containing protein n=1 Tax=Halioxenophilus aromaticivorans TaxID=1306992 RepID=A0AAV3U2I7_9ALTE